MPPSPGAAAMPRFPLSPPALSLLGLLVAPAALAQGPSPTLGPNPHLPAPEQSMIPTLNWAGVDRWKEGDKPTAAAGLDVNAFATGLKHPRWIYVLPNGDVLVAEAASEPSGSWGPRAMVQTMVQRMAGSITENANRISLLRDTDGDGVADISTPFLEGLRQPFGMALIGDTLYVANTDSVVSFPYKEGDTRIADKGTRLLDLPVGHHWTRNILPSRDGSKLYVTVGSGSNIGEKGMEIEAGRGTILEYDIADKQSRIFASGLRNANGMGWEPATGELWTVVNERDEIGDDLPPDYLTSVKDGGFYGWPWSYWGKNVDERVKPQRPEMVEKALTPDYALGGHTAALGLTFDTGAELPAPYRNGAFIGLHGSWNRKDLSGYKVIFVPFTNGRPNGEPINVLTDFISTDGNENARGRPVGVAFDSRGALLVADDVGNTVWRVTAAPGNPATRPD